MALESGSVQPEGGVLIHIGTPKTGSTAIQNFLRSNTEALEKKKTHYISHMRRGIGHNFLASRLLGRNAMQVWSSVTEEIKSYPGALCIISSEGLFQSAFADAIKQYMPKDLRGRSRIIVYLRRQDNYLEALYKQGVKRGRLNVSPQAFLDQQIARRCDYATVVERFADVIGPDQITLRRFERPALTGGDIVTDFLSLIGLSKEDGDFVQPTQVFNQTYSRAVSEQLGALARHCGVNVRMLVQELARDPEGAPLRSGDVFTKQQRCEIMEQCKIGNAELARRFLGAETRTLFDMHDLADDAPERYPVPAEQWALYVEAQERVASAIGRIKQKNLRKLFRA